MNYSRACHSSVVLGGSILTFGGLKDPESKIMDVVSRRAPEKKQFSYHVQVTVYVCISKYTEHQIDNVQIMSSYSFQRVSQY